MKVIFDGRKFAGQKEIELKKKVDSLVKAKAKIPSLASILIGDNPASKLYLDLKAKAAKRIGVNYYQSNYGENVEFSKVEDFIKHLNQDPRITAIMIQLPIQGKLKEKTNELINTIDKSKDVDGLREDSLFTPATVVAVRAIMLNAKIDKEKKIVVVGSKGEVGKRLLRNLENDGFRVEGVDKEAKNLREITLGADVVISATGIEDLIKPNMVSEGVVALDIGSPKGDFDPKVVQKSSFFTPVPGGVGPVTVVSLFENLIISLTA